MIIDGHIYTFKDHIKWSFRSFIVKEFKYDEPPQFAFKGTDLDGIKWRYGMSFMFEEDFSSLTFNFDISVSFPDRDTKILHEYIKMRETTVVSLLGLEEYKEDQTMIRELVAHCAAMNWMSILRAVSERSWNTILEGKISTPLTMPSQFMPDSLEDLHTVGEPDANKARKYSPDEFQRALDILDRAGRTPDNMPKITYVQWAIDVVKDWMRDKSGEQLVQEARRLVEEKKKALSIQFRLADRPNSPEHPNPNYKAVTIAIYNGDLNQKIVDYWFEDEDGERPYAYPYAPHLTYDLQPHEVYTIESGCYPTKKQLRVGIRLENYYDGAMVWSEYATLADLEKNLKLGKELHGKLESPEVV